MVFKNGSSKFCGRQPLADHFTANFLKAFLHKFYLVHSWIPWSICYIYCKWIGLFEVSKLPQMDPLKWFFLILVSDILYSGVKTRGIFIRFMLFFLKKKFSWRLILKWNTRSNLYPKSLLIVYGSPRWIYIPKLHLLKFTITMFIYIEVIILKL